MEGPKPEELAKKLFVYTMIATALYVGVIYVFILSR